MTSTIINTKQAQQGIDLVQGCHDELAKGAIKDNVQAIQIRHRLADALIYFHGAGFPEPRGPKAKKKHMKHSPVSPPETKPPELPKGDPLGPGKDSPQSPRSDTEETGGDES